MHDLSKGYYYGENMLKKLPHIDMFHILKSLTYFEDAELDADPKMILKASWNEMKNNIIKKANAFLAE